MIVPSFPADKQAKDQAEHAKSSHEEKERIVMERAKAPERKEVTRRQAYADDTGDQGEEQ
jgi:hypothetical protein